MKRSDRIRNARIRYLCLYVISLVERAYKGIQTWHEHFLIKIMRLAKKVLMSEVIGN